MPTWKLRVSMVCEYFIDADTEEEANHLLEAHLPEDMMFVDGVTITEQPVIKEEPDETTKPQS